MSCPGRSGGLVAHAARGGSWRHRRTGGLLGVGSAVLVAAALVAVTPASASARPDRPRTASVFARVVGVAALPGTNTAWAGVTEGENASPYSQEAQIWSWNGTKWVNQTIPSLGADSYVNAIVAISKTDAWALVAGGASTSSYAPMMLHYTGSGWKVVALPTADQSGYFGYLTASGSTIWITGDVGSQALALRYDGSWSSKDLPLTSSEGVQAISADGPTDLWVEAVSCPTSACTYKVLEPTSSGWKTLSVPAKTEAASLAAHSTTDVLLGGNVPGAVASTYTPVVDVLHGTTWAATKLRKTLDSGNADSLDVLAPTQIWVTGNQWTNRNYQILVDRLDGTKWVQEPVKVPGQTAFYEALGAASMTDAWLFGESWSGLPCSSTGTTVAYHFTGTAWQKVTTPTPALGAGRLGVPAVEPRC